MILSLNIYNYFSIAIVGIATDLQENNAFTPDKLLKSSVHLFICFGSVCFLTSYSIFWKRKIG